MMDPDAFHGFREGAQDPSLAAGVYYPDASGSPRVTSPGLSLDDFLYTSEGWAFPGETHAIPPGQIVMSKETQTMST